MRFEQVKKGAEFWIYRRHFNSATERVAKVGLITLKDRTRCLRTDAVILFAGL